jgi:tetratricopeptide (TPR) repeat protein
LLACASLAGVCRGQLFATADEFLDAVEASDKDIRRLTAMMQYHRIFELAGDEQTRLGTLQFVNTPAEDGEPAERKFAIRFDQVIVGGRRERDGRTFVFDGEWLIERIPKDKLMLRRQVAPPGAGFDPLKVGEGPLPIPLGQAKADILNRYEVTMPEPTAGIAGREDADKLTNFIEAMDAGQLRLVPRDDDDQFVEIRLWYRPVETGVLPCMAITRNRTGDEVMVQLVEFRLNDAARIDEDAFSREAPADWDVEETPFREGRGPEVGGVSPVLAKGLPGQPELTVMPELPEADVELLDQFAMPTAVAALIEAPYTTEAEAAALRVFHGHWSAEDLASAELAAMSAVHRGAYDDPALFDETVPATVRAEAAIARGELDRGLELLAGDASYRAVRLRAEALELLGRRDEALAATEVAVDRLLREKTESASELTDGVRTLMIRARLAGPERADGTDFQTLMALLTRAGGELDRLYWPAKLAEAELLYSKDERGRAAEAAQEAIALNPASAKAWAILGRLSVDAFEFDRAEDIAQRLDALAAMDTAWWSGDGGPVPSVDLPSVLGTLVVARTRVRQDAPATGIERAESLLLAYPEQRAVLAALAALHAANYDEAELEATLARLDELSPGTELGYLEAGWAYSERRQYGPSAAMLEEAMARQPNRPEAAILLGLLELQSGRDLNALAALRRVAELDPFNARAINSLELIEELVNYETIESEHFIVRYKPGVDRILAREMPGVLERIHARVTGAADGGIDHEPAQKTVIELMPDHAWFAVRIAGMPQLHTIAASTGPVIAMEAPKVGPGHKVGAYDWRRTLQHEYVHTVTLSRTDNRLPHWFTEAAAQYLEDAPRDENTCRLLAAKLREGGLFDMDEINIRFTRPRNPEDRSLAYAQGHWMYEFMVERFGDEAPRKLMDAYARGEREAEAMPSVLGVDRETFLAEFTAWAGAQVESWGLAEDALPRVRALAEMIEIAEAGSADRVALLEEWAEMVPVAERPHRELIKHYLASDDPAEQAKAIPHLEFLDARAQYTPAYAAALATRYAEAGDAERALEKAERAVSIAPFDADQRELAARVALVARDMHAAKRHLMALVQIEPDRPEHKRRVTRLLELMQEG